MNTRYYWRKQAEKTSYIEAARLAGMVKNKTKPVKRLSDSDYNGYQNFLNFCKEPTKSKIEEKLHKRMIELAGVTE